MIEERLFSSKLLRRLFVEQAKKKAEKWMQDTGILEAIEKYKNVSMKYESE
ncbi:hypothetical protein [Paenibacillus sp. FSL H7-0331]|uniref:hypothetical protein n=1 Tax=Paenibacillus sp. FSL H7-0331 TaxID=1920421 RepID=UPI0015C2C967|nr:hypothetical protein [Paenibacillus sp. FSL H7-0331]